MTEMPMSWLLIVVAMKVLWAFSAGVLNNTRDCNDSCSHEVNCTLSPYKSGFCGAEGKHRTSGTHGPDISAGPVDLNLQTSKDSQYQYIYLSWKPPQDGSYNYLTGFLVQVTVISLEQSNPGLASTTCFKLLPATNWHETHRSLHQQGGVMFFMNCLRFPVMTGLDIVISIHSLPVKTDSPKLAVKNVIFEPDAIYWNPRFNKWADVHDVMHLVINNPLAVAKFYDIKIKAVERDMVVFAHTFPAEPTVTDKLVVVNKDGLPHFLIPNLSKGDNYSILLEVLDENMTLMTHIHRVRTKPFTLNFTSAALVAPASRVSLQLDNRLVIIVSTAVVVFVGLLVCLIWKGVVRPSKLRNLVRSCAGKLSGSQRHRYISFTPIYCHESDSYVSAVENHVSLLHRCLDTLTTQAGADTPLCCCRDDTQPWLDTQDKGHNIIIYLSPRLGEILTFGPVPPSHCCKLDAVCHQALLSLFELCQKGQGLIPVIVTFDCFKRAELAVLSELVPWLFPAQPSGDCDLLTPLRLASLTSRGYTIENLEQVLARFEYQHQSLPQTADVFQGWREYEEVKAIERCLSVLEESAADTDKQLPVACSEASCSVSENCEACSYSRTSTQCPRDPTRSVSDHMGEDPDNAEFRISHDGVTFLPDAPLISNSTGYHSVSDCHGSSHSVSKIPLTNTYTCSEPSHDKSNTSPKNTYTNEKLITQSFYRQNKTEPQSYRPSDERSLPVKDGRAINNVQNNVKYQPNNLGEPVDTSDAFSVNSVESDSLLKSNNLSGCGRNMGHYFKDVSDDLEWGSYRPVKVTGSFIPPSLNDSNFTSMESVCERINRVNEHSGWSELNLSK